MSKMCYYARLNIDSAATFAEIKAAYRTLVKDCHPDTSADPEQATEVFHKLTEAYKVLSDVELRKEYDETEGKGSSKDSSKKAIFSNLGGLIVSLFKRPKQGIPEANIHLKHSIEFHDSFHGCVHEIGFTRIVPCPVCAGAALLYVDFCEKTAEENANSSETILYPVLPCKKCENSGVVPQEALIEVTIPKSTKDQDILRLPKAGNKLTRDLYHGDVFVNIEVKPHKIFQRQESNLHARQTITMYEAALGTTLKMETFRGSLEIEVPPGSQPEEVLVIPKAGMEKTKNCPQGDLHIHLHVTVPKTLSKQSTELLKLLNEFT